MVVAFVHSLLGIGREREAQDRAADDEESRRTPRHFSCVVQRQWHLRRCRNVKHDVLAAVVCVAALCQAKQELWRPEANRSAPGPSRKKRYRGRVRAPPRLRANTCRRPAPIIPTAKIPSYRVLKVTVPVQLQVQRAGLLSACCCHDGDAAEAAARTRPRQASPARKEAAPCFAQTKGGRPMLHTPQKQQQQLIHQQQAAVGERKGREGWGSNSTCVYRVGGGMCFGGLVIKGRPTCRLPGMTRGRKSGGIKRGGCVWEG